MENLIFKDDVFFDLDFDNLTDDQREELSHKVLAAQKDPRYSDPGRRQKSYVEAVNLAWSKLFPGERPGC